MVKYNEIIDHCSNKYDELLKDNTEANIAYAKGIATNLDAYITFDLDKLSTASKSP